MQRNQVGDTIVQGDGPDGQVAHGVKADKDNRYAVYVAVAWCCVVRSK